MYNYFFTIALTLVSILSVAQTKCDKTEDAFTGEIHTVFKWGNDSYPLIKLTRKESNPVQLTYVIYHHDGIINKTFPIGTLIYFKLENGKILELRSINAAKSEIRSISVNGIGKTYSLANLVFDLTKEQISLLNSSKLTNIKVPTMDGKFKNLDPKLTKKYSKAISSGMKCIGN